MRTEPYAIVLHHLDGLGFCRREKHWYYKTDRGRNKRLAQIVKTFSLDCNGVTDLITGDLLWGHSIKHDDDYPDL